MKNKTQKGYALLITIIIISIILLIATGLSSSTSKQLILSSSAKDSQIAFYQADTASECALYADYKGAIFEKVTDSETGAVTVTTNLINPFTCGIDSNGNSIPMVVSPGSNGSYDINPPSDIESSNEPCFRIEVTKSGISPAIVTTIKASGYNMCNRDNIRTVERTIQVSY